MMYLSKGEALSGSTEHILHIAHCGMEYPLAGLEARLWLNGRSCPACTKDAGENVSLRHLQRMGLAASVPEEGGSGLFRLLSACVICPVAERRPHWLRRNERRLWQWISNAGLRLTIAELIQLREAQLEPCSSLLGVENRQALTEAIYTRESIFDGVLESKMGASPYRDEVVSGVLGLLRKRKLVLL